MSDQKKYYVGRSYANTPAEFLELAKNTLELAGESNIEFSIPYQTTGRPGFYGVAYISDKDGTQNVD